MHYYKLSYHFGLLLLVIGTFSCSPKIVTNAIKPYPPAKEYAELPVYQDKSEVPDEAEVIGDVFVGESGLTTQCSYNYVVYCAQEEARKIGGTALLIVEHIRPSFMSTCHQISAMILKDSGYEDSEGTEIKPDSQESTLTVEAAMARQGIVENKPPFERKWRKSLYGGWSKITSDLPPDISPDLKDYLEKLTSGYHLGVDLMYQTGPFFSFGVKYNFFQSKNSGDFVAQDDNGNLVYLTLSDNIKYHFAAASMNMIYQSHANKNEWLIGFSMGYLGLRNDAVIDTPVKISGDTFGVGFDFGYNIMMSDKLGLGLQMSLLGGSFGKMKYKDDTGTHVVEFEEDEREGISRLDFSVALRF